MIIKHKMTLPGEEFVNPIAKVKQTVSTPTKSVSYIPMLLGVVGVIAIGVLVYKVSAGNNLTKKCSGN